MQLRLCQHIMPSVLLIHALLLCSCEQGIRGEAMGMLGKSWSTGALMMVQVADTLPRGFHPRTKLEGTLTYSPSPLDKPHCTPSARLSYETVN